MDHPPNPHRINGLDGMRALAALAVFGVHFNQTVRLDAQLGPFDLARLLANGEHGVSLFFALSGFLLGLPFWRALNRGPGLPDLKVYAVRRLARIMPAYYGALTLLILLSGLWGFPQAFPDIALHYTFLFNLAEFSIFSINAPFWTLAVEMQFYALLPLLFLLLAKAGAHWRLPLLVLLCVGVYLIHYWLMNSVTRIIAWPLDPLLVWVRPYGAMLSHSLLAHLPHFLFGVIAGRLFLWRHRHVNEQRRDSRRINETLFWGALGLTLVLISTPLEDAVQIPYGRYGLPLVPLLLAVMIFTAPMTRFARRLLDGFPLRGLGVISYGIYIYHLPCLMFLDRFMAGRGMDAAEHWLVFGLAGLALSIGIATVSYLLIERPLIRVARKRA